MGTRHPAESAQQALAGQRILVTGAAGFIGTTLCRYLVQSGAQVYGVSRTAREKQHGVHWWRADLASSTATNELMRSIEPELVVHLASHVSGDRAISTVLPTVRDNLVTTVNLLTAACKTGSPRVVLAGSMEEWDIGDRATVPGSPYAAAKTAAGIYIRMFHTLYSLPVVHLRIFMVYGPGQRDETKLIPYVTTSLLRGEQPSLTSGLREVDWIYVDDVVSAIMVAAGANDANGTVLDIGSGELVTVRAVVDRITRLVAGVTEPQFGALKDRPLERVRVANLSRTSQLIGWKPTVPLEEGLEHTVQWYRAQQHLTEET